MARLRRAALVGMVMVGSVLVPIGTHAAGATTLYVDNRTPGACSDAGSGTQAQPYCTIQAAADVVTAGQTVSIIGFYLGNVTLTHSGTPTSPIVFDGHAMDMATIQAADDAQPTVTFAGVHDVRFAHIDAETDPDATPGVAAVAVTGSSRVTIDGSATFSFRLQTGVHIDGTSDHISVINSLLDANGTDIAVDAGSSDDTFAGNQMSDNDNLGIAVAGAPGTAITNNSFFEACDQAISVTGASAGTTIENNFISTVAGPDTDPNCPATPTVAAIVVDSAAAAAGVTADYNLEYLQSPTRSTYVWAGTAYPDIDSFTAATGQGTHDIAKDPSVDGSGAGLDEGSPAIDSANDAAPGVPALDFDGRPRVDDPLTPDTGAGPITYLDRGAFEWQDRFLSGDATTSATQAPVGGVVSFTGVFTDVWNLPFTCAFDFGDGTTGSGPCNTTHAYATAGTFTWQVTANNGTGGITVPMSGTITVVSGGTFTASVAVAATGARGVVATASAGTDPWNVVSVTYTFGDGSPSIVTSDLSQFHEYALPGTYKVTAKITDAGGVKKTMSKNFTTAGTNFVAVTPQRLADTTITAHGTAAVAVAGIGGIPAGVAAVAVNITAVTPSAAGTVTAWADGKTRPGTSNLNFVAGRSQADESFVAVGTDGSIRLLNGSSGANEFTVDVVGYFSATATGDRYQDVTPATVADTTTGGGQVQPGSPLTVTLDGVAGVPSSGVDAVMLNVTALNSATAGALTVYPAGATAPAVANIEYAAGQTVGNLVVVPVSSAGQIEVAASGATDVVVDVAGYFSATAPEAYVPVPPVRQSTVTVPAATTSLFNIADGIQNLSPSVFTLMIDVTITGATGTGQMTVSANSPNPPPSVFQVHWVKSQQSANNVAAQASGPDFGNILENFTNASTKPVNVTVDTYGYFASV